MSTFDGRLPEFPDIRIDFFRRQGDSQPPLACFLSHVHSDHLAGLETLRSPFVYCSAATRAILLRLERYPCRINYAKGILEARQQTYKHLEKVLKPLPLNTTTCLELCPGRDIQVTLFDANHCPGAVMFLIEGAGKAILYTGDVRSEPWFVSSLTRNPSLIEYTGGIKTLDKIYLDTSFTREDPFQTKAEGIKELLKKVAAYPDDTIFHLQAWTFGYEEVWIALCRALKCQVHVDDYKMKIYNSLRSQSTSPSTNLFSPSHHLCPEAPALVGYLSGNTPQPGCLSSNENARLHSCEKGNMCTVATGKDVVKIQPVVAHLRGGGELLEIGVGGGGDDLERDAELDLDLNGGLASLFDMIDTDQRDPKANEDLKARLLEMSMSIGRKLSLDMNLVSFDENQCTTLEETLRSLRNRAQAKCPMSSGQPFSRESTIVSSNVHLPRTIRFPYSRHSSYPELCDLVKAFRPLDVWPCTVNPKEWKREGQSIASLFGRYCSGTIFSYDDVLMQLDELEEQFQGSPRRDTQKSAGTDSRASDDSPQFLSLLQDTYIPPTMQPEADVIVIDSSQSTSEVLIPGTISEDGSIPVVTKRSYDEYISSSEVPDEDVQELSHDREQLYEQDLGDSQQSNRSFTSTLSERHSLAQREAYYNMLDYMKGDVWTPLGLLSTDDNHTFWDKEL